MKLFSSFRIFSFTQNWININIYYLSPKPVLRIHLILMRIQIRILDPYWKKMDPNPDPGQFFNLYGIFLTKKSNFCFIFSLIFILKLDEPLRNEEIFIISLFSKVQIWVLGVKKFFLQFLVDI